MTNRKRYSELAREVRDLWRAGELTEEKFAASFREAEKLFEREEDVDMEPFAIFGEPKWLRKLGFG